MLLHYVLNVSSTINYYYYYYKVYLVISCISFKASMGRCKCQSLFTHER